MIPNYEINPDLFDKYSEVNRLIIIGNGFDIAHGLKTSFKDFIEDYYYKILKNIKDNLEHNDILLEINSKVRFSHLNRNFSPSEAFLEVRSLMNNSRITIEKESELLKKIGSTTNLME
jgi:hypothetical protein